MDGTSLQRFSAASGARVAAGTSISRSRLPTLLIGLALAIAPTTAALAVPEDLVAAPGFATLQSDTSSVADRPDAARPIADRFAAKQAAKAAMVSRPVIQAVLATDAATADDDAEPIGAGNASWYGRQFAGRPTASGERFNPTGLTAAHRTLPFGSKVRVTSQRTGQSIVVRINDRGPFHGNRLIDLSEAAADAIGLKARGQDRVELALLD